ncbi:hypothetical protein Scep_019105 [Stephania cephalantha]|uniref:Helitron helicase-like domain-containing protein n=1 Tax=Stephania cephalantha TaxID=152367 RepID=A0AAP0IB71_9MAGN
MMHGPCGTLNPNNVCMDSDGKCKNNFPKPFRDCTSHGKGSYPKYRRRNDGNIVLVRKHNLDNRWVVPYNPYLLAKFDCHLNVEVCSTIKAVKYMYKYIYKGHDRIAIRCTDNNDNADIDEIERFQSSRWVAAPEAMWRIYGFPLNEIYPPLITLQLHLEGKQLVKFNKNDVLQNLVDNGLSSRSMLTEYFNMNQNDNLARTILYREFPEYFVWNQQVRRWTRRQKRQVIARVVAANPMEGERYYLRLLLNHIKGCTSFQNSKLSMVFMHHHIKKHILHMLLDVDNSLDLCLEEASAYQMPFTLRRLFATILLHRDPENPRHLWEKFRSELCLDFERLQLSVIETNLRALQRY